ncbi:MAG: type II toxin-antitoxin system VapC family toxin [Elusimicrobia bacterium]|nr:type II toxin-antitoxin system VapC family toxin [Elusimicrobiota bacterium]
MEWVLDSSLALAWALPDENQGRADRFLAKFTPQDALWVPGLWWHEIANALTMAERRNRIAEADIFRLLELYNHLPIQTDTSYSSALSWRYFILAREYGLTAYDGSYLELAERKGLPLASFDERLIKAARKAGLRTIHN